MDWMGSLMDTPGVGLFIIVKNRFYGKTHSSKMEEI